jgi:hypothetical protein
MASTHPAVASTHPATTAQPATSTNIDQTYVGASLCDGHQWYYCLWYSQGETGAVWGAIQMGYGTISPRSRMTASWARGSRCGTTLRPWGTTR